jgi:hypothetical protein
MRFLTTIFAFLLLLAAPSRSQEPDPVATLPEGKGRDLLQAACVQCHSLKTAVTGRKTAEEWKTTVYDMISRGAQVFPDEAEIIIEYLTKYRGPEGEK